MPIDLTKPAPMPPPTLHTQAAAELSEAMKRLDGLPQDGRYFVDVDATWSRGLEAYGGRRLTRGVDLGGFVTVTRERRDVGLRLRVRR